MGYFEARTRAWVPLDNAISLSDLLIRLGPTGVLADLREPLTEDRFADRADLDGPVATATLAALERLGVTRRDGARHTLTPAWLALTAADAFAPLDTMIAGQQVGSRIFQNLGRLSYAELTPADQLAMAKAVSPDPTSNALVDIYRSSLETDPVGRAILGGGRFLELGCGVAGRLLLTLRASPRLSAVGVELSPALAAEAERRAVQLGVAERFTVVCGDAADFVADEPFDFGFWSQFFFPDGSRAAALEVMLTSLRPGGTFQAPLGSDPAAAARNPSVATYNAIWQVMLRAWGVPERDSETLAREITDAGFVDVEVVAREAGPALRATRP